jgi:D-alanyl-D-alanine carboxypeptidase
MAWCGGCSRIGRFVGLAAALTVLSIASPPAQAHHYRHHHYYAIAIRPHSHFAYRSARQAVAAVPASAVFSAIVVDANSGRTLYSAYEDGLRHPASITKVMTLYLLFEELDRGAITLRTQIPISEHAAAQEPSKLGIAPGQTISVEDAIKAVVTRSANDVAVAIAEAVGHTEENFADMMTRKAHALGMSSTVYRNASGLPNDEQVTTARDLTILASSLEDRFPRYFRYFSTAEFDYAGEVIGNHNHLLGRIDGVDGIKTGYTRASGFNLLTSVHRDGRSLIAVVMGGRTAGARDRIMENLIADHIAEASTSRTATMVAES